MFCVAGAAKGLDSSGGRQIEVSRFQQKNRFPNRDELKNRCLENKLLLISINFTPKNSHSLLKKLYTMFSRCFFLSRKEHGASLVPKKGGRLELLLRGSGYLGYVDSNQGYFIPISGLYVPKS